MYSNYCCGKRKKAVDFWSNRKPLSKPQPLKNKGKTATGRKPNDTQITIN